MGPGEQICCISLRCNSFPFYIIAMICLKQCFSIIRKKKDFKNIFYDSLNTFDLCLCGIRYMVEKTVQIVREEPAATSTWAILSN